MSAAASMFSPANIISPSPISITDGCQVNLTGEMNSEQVDREQDIQEQKVKLGWGAIIAGTCIAICGLIVACITAKK